MQSLSCPDFATQAEQKTERFILFAFAFSLIIKVSSARFHHLTKSLCSPFNTQLFPLKHESPFFSFSFLFLFSLRSGNSEHVVTVFGKVCGLIWKRHAVRLHSWRLSEAADFPASAATVVGNVASQREGSGWNPELSWVLIISRAVAGFRRRFGIHRGRLCLVLGGATNSSFLFKFKFSSIPQVEKEDMGGVWRGRSGGREGRKEFCAVSCLHRQTNQSAVKQQLSAFPFPGCDPGFQKFGQSAGAKTSPGFYNRFYFAPLQFGMDLTAPAGWRLKMTQKRGNRKQRAASPAPPGARLISAWNVWFDFSFFWTVKEIKFY